MLLFRIDNRLIHGQIIEAWLPYLRAKHLIVANDELANDSLRQQILALAIPKHVHVHFITICKLPTILKKIGTNKVLVVLENCNDAACALSLDIPKPQVNVGNLHFGPNKKQLLSHIAVTDNELELLKVLNSEFSLDFRAVPSEKPRGLHEL